MYRPKFIETENMKRLGFDLISDERGYLKYQNDGSIHYNKDYNKNFPEPRGKVILSINTTYLKEGDIFYLAIQQDGGTRTSYSGICDNEEFLINLLNKIR